MKTLQKIGLGLFLIGIGLFTGNIFLGEYEFSIEKTENYFDATPDVIDKGDTIVSGFVTATASYHADNSDGTNMASIFGFNKALPIIIDNYNSSISRSLVNTNGISNSEIKEQKSYKINRIFIKLNCNQECISLFIKPIKYFSFIYDEIIIESSKNIDEIKNKFYYDNTIKYNIDLKDDNFKQEYIFEKNNYLLNEIYEIISINEKDLELI